MRLGTSLFIAALIVLLMIMQLAGIAIVPPLLGVLKSWLLGFPMAAESTADILSAWAWPVVVLFFLVRYRTRVTDILDTLAERLRRDKLKLGPFEMVPNTDVLALDPQDAAESTEVFSPEDVDRIERLFEFIVEPANFNSLADWISNNVDTALDIGSFLTEPPYANQREQAYQALVQ